ncbi:hypothetical protein Zmor_015424 [Zophobas morio]|uniref:Peptidase S1 domain-containing protein n=2 Tax=Zophobas morio TaxID=2755281 RepID=A0AA38IH27_9CUCU|nr:hypothetical protein Zmor_015424 [Zophobas morio]
MHLKVAASFLLLLALINVHQTEEISRDSRIIGGLDANAGQYKFAAAITVTTETSRFFCGGSLLTNQWIITAGQCVNGATLFTIQIGSNKLTEDDTNRVIVATSEYVIHPEFNPTTLENDVGLIKLRIPVEFTNYVNTIYYADSTPVGNSTSLVAIGWGQTSDDDPELSEHLQGVQVVSISNEECRFTYGSQLTDNMLCVAGSYNEGTCIGDTGSALIQIVSRGAQVHTGIASFVSGNGCQSTDPSGYTRTHPYLDWIKSIILA